MKLKKCARQAFQKACFLLSIRINNGYKDVHQHSWRLCIKVLLWSKNHFLFFLPILKASSRNIQLAKFWALRFIRNLFILSVSFGFDDPPLLTFKADRLDLRGLDLEKMTSFTHQLKISACKRNLLYMQNTDLKSAGKLKTPVLHINSAAYTRVAFLN